MIPVTLAVEDVVAEALVHRIIVEEALPLQIEQTLQQKGITYLRSRAQSLNRAAFGGIKSIMLADADSPACPVGLAAAWFPDGKHPNLAFRFAVREAESWIVADATGLAQFLGISISRVPLEPDALHDPKRAIVDLARRSPRRELRSLIAPANQSIVQVGPGYNACMTRFIRSGWSAGRAATGSPSLAQFMVRLARLAGDSSNTG